MKFSCSDPWLYIYLLIPLGALIGWLLNDVFWTAIILFFALIATITILLWSIFRKFLPKKSDSFLDIKLPESFDHDAPDAEITKFVIRHKRFEKIIASTKKKKFVSSKSVLKQLDRINDGLQKPTVETKNTFEPLLIEEAEAVAYSEKFACSAIYFKPLHPFIYGSDILASTKCWIGGRPKMPSYMQWPRDNNGIPLHFVAQFDCSELPIEVAEPSCIPTSGTIYFFAILDGEFTDISEDQSQSHLFYTADNYEDLTTQTPPDDMKNIYHIDGYSSSFERNGIVHDALCELPKVPLSPCLFTSYPNLGQLKEFCGISVKSSTGDAWERIEELNRQALVDALDIDLEARAIAFRNLFDAVTKTEVTKFPVYNFFCKHLANVYHEEILSKHDRAKTDLDRNACKKVISKFDEVISYCATANPWEEIPTHILPTLRDAIDLSKDVFGEANWKRHLEKNTFQNRSHIQARRELRKLILSSAISPSNFPFTKPLQEGFLHIFDPVTLGKSPLRRSIHQMGGFYQCVQSDIAGINCNGNVLFRLSDDEDCGLDFGDNGHLFVTRRLDSSGAFDFNETYTFHECT